MTTKPMTKDEQAVLFNRILKNQIVMMSAIEEIRLKTTGEKVSMFQNISKAIKETKDTKRIVEYVEKW